MKKQKIIWSEQNEGESYNVQIGASLQYILHSSYQSFCCYLLRDQRQELTKVNETSQQSMQRVYLCLMPQYLLSAITIVYWVFTHSITPPPASPSRVIYQAGARVLVLMRDLCKLWAVTAPAPDTGPRVTNYLETTITIITIITPRTSHIIIIVIGGKNQESETGKGGVSTARKSEAFLCGLLLSCRQKCWSHRRKVFSILLMK